MPDDAAFCPYCGEPAPASAVAARTSPDDYAAPRLQPAPSSAADKHPAERELWNDTYSPKALAGPAMALAAIVFAGLVGVALYWNTGIGWLVLAAGALVGFGGLALNLLYQRLSVRYRVTTYRLFHERGILSRVTDRMEMIDIDDVTVKQGLIERMFGVGTLMIASSDRTHPRLYLPGIDDVKRIADLIDDARRAERQRRGLHIESI